MFSATWRASRPTFPTVPSSSTWTASTPTSESGGGLVCHPRATGTVTPGARRYQNHAPSGPSEKGGDPGA
jgi:hypothetical protein